MRNNIKEKNPVVVVLDVVIAVLCVLIVVAAIGVFAEFRDTGGYTAEESYYLYRLQDGDYSGIWQRYYSDAKHTEEKREYYAIAEYVEAAFLRKAFATAGDAARAQKYQERMEQAAEDTGALHNETDKIDAVLERY